MENEGKLNVSAITSRLTMINKNLEKVNVKDFIQLCLCFTKLSNSMGKLVSWGFQDIFTKCRILGDHEKTYPDLPTLQLIVEKEISLNIHILSGTNNDKYPHGKVPPYNNYESGKLLVKISIKNYFTSIVVSKSYIGTVKRTEALP